MKYYGKEKCRILKQIRAEIARQNEIEWVVEECTHKGNCKGTCPRCEAEVRQLEKALARREAMGRTVAVVGISAGLALSVSGCANPFPSTTAGVSVAPSDTSTESETEVLKGELVTDDTTAEDTEGEYTIPAFDLGAVPEPGEVPEMGDPVFDPNESGFEGETDEAGQPVEESTVGDE